MAAADVTSTGDEIEEESISRCESLRLKTLAEQTYSSSDLKSALKYAKRAHRLCPTIAGVSEMLAAFKILIAGANTTETTTTPHWYKILEVEPFSHINSIKKQYKKLALILHPDKNTFVASEEAFKLVNEAFGVLSDKIRRKEYDMKLRIAMQTAAEAGEESCGAIATVDTFWTACSTCRLLHQFERKYLGHNLMCPSCKKSFKAVEVEDDKDEGYNIEIKGSDRVSTRSNSKRKMSSVGEIMERSERSKNEDFSKNSRGLDGKEDEDSRVRDSKTLKKKGKKRLNDEDDEEMVTLAEMQRLAKRNVNEGKLKKDKIQRNGSRNGNSNNERSGAKNGDSENDLSGEDSGNLKKETNFEGDIQDLDIMQVEDSDFYDFDKGRVEKSFKKGHVWALYDDDDGMPRHYGLIDEVVSTHPFEVDMAWLDPQINGDEGLISLEKTRFNISCGRFKVSKKTSVNSLNVFSHIVNCERAAREVYRIFPKKGSVWALYNEDIVNIEGGNGLTRERRRYDIVVFLTSYSEVHGLSMGYLEKVNGFKTIFRRQDIGFRAIKWLEKHNVKLFSHQIPARKLSREEVADLSGDCWELDPASLPPDLLTISSRK